MPSRASSRIEIITKEVIDVGEITTASRKFYRKNALPSFAKALRQPDLSQRTKAKIAKFWKDDFRCGVVIPPAQVRTRNPWLTIQSLGSYEGCNKPYVEEGEDGPIPRATGLDRPEGAYLLMWRPGNVDQSYKGKSCVALRGIFKGNGWNGFDTLDHLIAAQMDFKSRGDHSFYQYDDDPEKSNVVFLTDSEVEPLEGAARAVYAFFYPKYRQVHLYWHRVAHFDVRLGARPAIVVPL